MNSTADPSAPPANRTEGPLADSHPLVATGQSRLIQALIGHRPETTPVWFMRQAGRSLPEYRALRAGGDMLEACLSPALASEITIQPVRRHGVDAAILFSDIVIPLKLVGVPVEIQAGRGPVFREAITSSAQVSALTRIDPSSMRAEAIIDAVQLTTTALAELSSERGEPIPLIGFAGAPFTLAAYLVAGGPSKDHMAARRLMAEDPAAWHALVEWLAELSGEFLAVQVRAGASAAQLFDSWAGALSPERYRAHARPAAAAALRSVRELVPPAISGLDHVPLIHFGVNTGELLDDMASVGVDALGVDYRTPLAEARRRITHDVTLQGNLDPAMLFAPAAERERAISAVLESGRAARAHVFNLGHGVPAEADAEVVSSVVRAVHRWRPE